MPRGLIVFLVVCALIAGGTLLARMVRLEREQAARYARVIASCASGRDFFIGRAIVSCIRTDVQ